MTVINGIEIDNIKYKENIVKLSVEQYKKEHKHEHIDTSVLLSELNVHRPDYFDDNSRKIFLKYYDLTLNDFKKYYLCKKLKHTKMYYYIKVINNYFILKYLLIIFC